MVVNRSTVGMERINFEAYTVQQLVEIVNARLEVAKAGQPEHPSVMKPDAVNFAARKVASIFGDARRVLDVCRYAHHLIFILFSHKLAN
jgi:origin recognition complex subunit 1